MSQKDFWRRLEENEDSWFSLWCDSIELECAKILYNRRFEDDPIFNHVTEIHCREESITKLVDKILEVFKRIDVKPFFYLSALTEPKNLSTILIQKGLRLFDHLKVMQLVEEKNVKINTDVVIDEVSEDLLDLWSRTFVKAFDVDSTWREEVFKRALLSLKRSDTHHFLARVKDRAVGILSLFSKDRIGGIYNVGTIPESRRKGVATSLLKRAISESERIGNRALCLQTLQQDRLEGFYNANGFTIVYIKEIYSL